MAAILHEFLKWLSDNNLSREGLYIIGSWGIVYLLMRGAKDFGKWLGQKNKEN